MTLLTLTPSGLIGLPEWFFRGSAVPRAGEQAGYPKLGRESVKSPLPTNVGIGRCVSRQESTSHPEVRRSVQKFARVSSESLIRAPRTRRFRLLLCATNCSTSSKSAELRNTPIWKAV